MNPQIQSEKHLELLTNAEIATTETETTALAEVGFDPDEINRRIDEMRRIAEEPQIDVDDKDA